MGCELCGLIDPVAAAKWINCIHQALGIAEFAEVRNEWTRGAHAALYEAVDPVRLSLEEMYPDVKPATDPGWGVEAGKTAKIASVIATVNRDVAERFWSCMAIAEDQAIAEATAREGDYWNAMLSAAALIIETESPSISTESAADGPLAAVTLLLGSIGTMVAAGWKRRR